MKASKWRKRKSDDYFLQFKYVRKRENTIREIKSKLNTNNISDDNVVDFTEKYLLGSQCFKNKKYKSYSQYYYTVKQIFSNYCR